MRVLSKRIRVAFSFFLLVTFGIGSSLTFSSFSDGQYQVVEADTDTGTDTGTDTDTGTAADCSSTSYVYSNNSTLDRSYTASCFTCELTDAYVIVRDENGNIIGRRYDRISKSLNATVTDCKYSSEAKKSCTELSMNGPGSNVDCASLFIPSL